MIISISFEKNVTLSIISFGEGENVIYDFDSPNIYAALKIVREKKSNNDIIIIIKY